MKRRTQQEQDHLCMVTITMCNACIDPSRCSMNGCLEADDLQAVLLPHRIE
jgi:hypothetical protein